MATTAITIEFDPDRLSGYDDKFLATLWHACQANPENGFENEEPGDLAMKVGWEIIRRWLRGVEPEMYHHQVRHYWWQQLRRFASYQPGEGHATAPLEDRERLFHAGTWHLRPQAVAKALPVGEAVVQAALEWQATRAPGADFMARSRAETALDEAVAALRDASQAAPADDGGESETPEVDS
jgi:hypothetical protein